VAVEKGEEAGSREDGPGPAAAKGAQPRSGNRESKQRAMPSRGEMNGQDFGPSVVFSNRPASARGGGGGGGGGVKGPGPSMTKSGKTAQQLEDDSESLKRERSTLANEAHATLGTQRHLARTLAAFAHVRTEPVLPASADNTVGSDLKKALMQARNAKGMTQKALAQALGCDAKTVNEYESGKAIPNNGLIAKMERALGAKLPRAPKK